jgi:dTMP kinase
VLILCDRYTDSTITDQSYGKNLEISLINHLNKIVLDGWESDLTLWIDVDVEEGLTKKHAKFFIV